MHTHSNIRTHVHKHKHTYVQAKISTSHRKNTGNKNAYAPQCSLSSPDVPRYVSRVTRFEFGFGCASAHSNATRYVIPGANCQLKMAVEGKMPLPWEAVPLGRSTV
jgi:hypothetical protein